MGTAIQTGFTQCRVWSSSPIQILGAHRAIMLWQNTICKIDLWSAKYFIDSVPKRFISLFERVQAWSAQMHRLRRVPQFDCHSKQNVVPG
jgi:hypothetical protein